MSLSRGERGIHPDDYKPDCPACSAKSIGNDCDECEWSWPNLRVRSEPVGQGYEKWTCRHCGESLGTSKSNPGPCESCLVERGLMDDDASTADLYTSA